MVIYKNINALWIWKNKNSTAESRSFRRNSLPDWRASSAPGILFSLICFQSWWKRTATETRAYNSVLTNTCNNIANHIIWQTIMINQFILKRNKINRRLSRFHCALLHYIGVFIIKVTKSGMPIPKMII